MVTLRQIVEISDLGITLSTSGPVPDVELTGAHASEQVDPTPWLRGGELVMIDGLNLGTTASAMRAYVRRLAKRDVRALAVGVGGRLPFSAVPRALVKAGEDLQLPVLAVPVTTPFIAITQAVYAAMAEERFATTQRTLVGQSRITAAAASAEPLTGIVEAFGNQASVWASVFDAHGALLASTGDDLGEARLVVQARADELRRSGLHGSASTASPSGAQVIQPLGTASLRGFLVYGSATGPVGVPLVSGLAAFAVALLSIELERRHVLRVLERRPGSEAIPRLVAGLPPVRAAQLIRSVGLRADRVQVLVVRGSRRPEELLDSLAAAHPDALLRREGADLLAILPADGESDGRLHALLADEVAGLGGPVSPHACPASHRQATHSADISATRRAGLVDAMDLGTVQVLLQLASADALAGFADSVLGPIESAATGSRPLLASLRAFLESNGSLETAATAAGVHRHTIRHHMRRVEELTGRRLDSPRDVTELWLAFEARDVLATL